MAPALARLLSLALEAHLGGLLRRAFSLERQRMDAARRLPGMAPTDDTRRQVGPCNSAARPASMSTRCLWYKHSAKSVAKQLCAKACRRCCWLLCKALLEVMSQQGV